VAIQLDSRLRRVAADSEAAARPLEVLAAAGFLEVPASVACPVTVRAAGLTGKERPAAVAEATAPPIAPGNAVFLPVASGHFMAFHSPISSRKSCFGTCLELPE
jgi:hypothetical protein